MKYLLISLFIALLITQATPSFSMERDKTNIETEHPCGISLTVEGSIKNITQEHGFTIVKLANNSHVLIKKNKMYVKDVKEYNFLQDNTLLFVTLLDNKAILMNVENDKTILEFETISHFRLLQNEQLLFVQYTNNTAELISLQDYQVKRKIEHINYIKDYKNNFLIVTLCNGTNELISLNNYKTIKKAKAISLHDISSSMLKRHKEKIQKLVIIPYYQDSHHVAELVNKDTGKTIRTYKNYKTYRIIYKTKLLIEYDNKAELIDLENSETIRIFDNFAQYKLHIATPYSQDPYLHYYWNVSYLISTKTNELIYLGNNSSYKTNKSGDIIKEKDVPFLIATLEDNSLVLIDFINHKSYVNVENYSWHINENKAYFFIKFKNKETSLRYYRNPKGSVAKLLVGIKNKSEIIEEIKEVQEFSNVDTYELSYPYLIIKDTGSNAHLLYLDAHGAESLRTFKNIDSFKTVCKKKLVLIKYKEKQKNPQLFDLTQNMLLDISLENKIDTCSLLCDETVLRTKRTDNSIELINLKTKKRVKIENPDEKSTTNLTDTIIWASSTDGTKKIVDTEQCQVLKTFKPDEHATINNNMLWYKEKKNSYKIVELAEILKSFELLKKKNVNEV